MRAGGGTASEAQPVETFLAKGKRGLTYTREQDGRTVLVKRKNPRSAVDTVANEARCTKIANTVDVGPKFLSYDAAKGELVRAYVAGEELRKWLPSAPGEATRRMLLSVLDQCRRLDGLRLDKEEMTRPWKNIIVTPAGEPVMIDFERCRETTVPKNVTQFCQFLTGSRTSLVLKTKGMAIDKKTILGLAKEYKEKIRANSAVEEVYARLFKEVERA